MAEFIYRKEILKGGDYRNRIFAHACVQFSSFLETNLAYMEVQGGGTLTGNGWEGCNMFGMSLTAVKMEMDFFRKCSMGNTRFTKTELQNVHFQECGCQGSIWTRSSIDDCRFETCSLRGMIFPGGFLRKSKFCDCVFEDVDMGDLIMERVVFQNCTFGGNFKLPEKGHVFRNCMFLE